MALEKITMPQLGESVTEGTVSNWLVKVGEEVNKYDPIAEVLTDKVNAEVPSSFTGEIKELVVKEGETIAVGEVMCTIEVEEMNKKSTQQAIAEEEIPEIKNESNQESMKKRYSPAVLRLAQENDIDLEQITGSGKGGRITRKDVEKVIQNGGLPQMGHVSQPKSTITSALLNTSTNLKINEGDIEIPVTGIRKTIAQNMVRSKHEIPHAWMTIEVDVTELVSYRNKIKGDFQDKEGFKLTYFPFFVKAVSEALKKFPQVNSTWQNDKIIQRKDINLSIAVAVEDQLFVPVIKNADEKSIKGIAKDIHDLATKARNHSLSVKDLEGGTFTINNTGIFGSIHSMGIINHPQAAILQVESIVKRPVIINNMFAARDIVNLCLSLDHRILDGLVCGRFLAFIKERLENMNEDNINIY
ncbi:dihydrolipoamide acetyltransferase family protein [Oceanobacillus caeni]|uniref:dihydrolipoamide acetyltransferase family protein n=1 Tax=Oceanobacillus caeni TaxID=405946 RepID=UPI001957A72D|nr:dihydrolipoamide acetyltransferase family protein [Oceanobacillus caeni]MBU8789800.1 2-oxo acid dehydrogenase subunit E2 [Oceanobacillus caeni]